MPTFRAEPYARGSMQPLLDRKWWRPGRRLASADARAYRAAEASGGVASRAEAFTSSRGCCPSEATGDQAEEGRVDDAFGGDAGRRRRDGAPRGDGSGGILGWLSRQFVNQLNAHSPCCDGRRSGILRFQPQDLCDDFCSFDGPSFMFSLVFFVLVLGAADYIALKIFKVLTLGKA